MTIFWNAFRRRLYLQGKTPCNGASMSLGPSHMNLLKIDNQPEKFDLSSVSLGPWRALKVIINSLNWATEPNSTKEVSSKLLLFLHDWIDPWVVQLQLSVTNLLQLPRDLQLPPYIENIARIVIREQVTSQQSCLTQESLKLVH